MTPAILAAMRPPRLPNLTRWRPGKTSISNNENLNHINNNTWSLFNDQSKLLLQVRQGASIVHQDNLLDIERFRNCLEKE